jgi:HSP20 family protein
MQQLAMALEDVKALHQKMLGRPAPELIPDSFAPFPVGVDPLQHALFEVQRLKELSQQVHVPPKPVTWLPIADCYTAEEEFVVRLDVPGVPREDLKVFVVDGECVVRGERKPLEQDEKTRFLSVERPWGPFERRFVVPGGCDVAEMKARAIDGVLELRMPMKEVAPPERKEFEVS